MPPTFMLEEMCHRNMAFTLYHASEMPKLEWDPPEVVEVSPGLWRVRVEIRNMKAIPTRSAVARQKQMGTPDRLTISPRNGKVLAGGRLGRVRSTRRRPSTSSTGPSASSSTAACKGNGRLRVEWLLSCPSGRPDFGLRYEAEKGGVLER